MNNEQTVTEDHMAANIDHVRSIIAEAALRVGRAPEEITLVAVSKTMPVELVQMAYNLGVTDFGENRVQEAESKIPDVGRIAARWHLIGHLQSNKARRAVEIFDCIHPLDSSDLAQRLNRICDELERQELPVLIQVDLGQETTKTGVEEKDVSELVAVIRDCPRLRLTGLMTLPPFFDEAESVRPYFRRLRELREELKANGAFGDHPGELSMGMTHDFEVAIEEGATMVRIGTAIFGERVPRP